VAHGLSAAGSHCQALDGGCARGGRNTNQLEYEVSPSFFVCFVFCISERFVTRNRKTSRHHKKRFGIWKKKVYVENFSQDNQEQIKPSHKKSNAVLF
jgi:hypothetical protein